MSSEGAPSGGSRAPLGAEGGEGGGAAVGTAVGLRGSNGETRTVVPSSSDRVMVVTRGPWLANPSRVGGVVQWGREGAKEGGEIPLVLIGNGIGCFFHK